jgi:hypothetical protein
MPHGDGILTLDDNTTKEGAWQKGQFIGGSAKK